MDKPLIVNQNLLPLFAQHYESYLPFVFDDNLTMLEKVNKIIIYLNKLGKLSNDVLNQWNQVMEWVMADGLNASIDEKLNAMLADGTLAKIINEDIFNDLNTRLTADEATLAAKLETQIFNDYKTANDLSISTLNANVGKLTQKLPKVYVEDFLSDVTNLNQTNEDWTTAIQNALNSTPSYKTVVLPMKTIRFTKTLEVPFGTSLIGQGNASTLQADFGSWQTTDYRAIHFNNCEGIDYHENGMNCVVENFRLIGLNNANKESIGIECSTYSNISVSSAVNYSTTFTYFEHLYVSHFDKAFNLPECWMSTFSDISVMYCRVGFNIVGKSVNLVFNNLICTNFDRSSTPNTGATMGFYLDEKTTYGSGSYGFPEGIIISDSLLFGADNAVFANAGLLVRISDSILDGCSSDGVKIGSVRDISVRGCYIAVNGNNTSGVLILDKLVGDSNISICHNDFIAMIDGTPHYGVKAPLNTRERYGIVVDGNQFYGFTTAVWVNRFDKGKIINNHGREGRGVFIYCESDCNKTLIDGNTSEDQYAVVQIQPYTDSSLIIGDNHSSANQTSFRGKVTLPVGATSVALPNNFYNAVTGDTYVRAVTIVSTSNNIGNYWIGNEENYSQATLYCSAAPAQDVKIRYEVKAIPFSGV
jgi:hypothetical protein